MRRQTIAALAAAALIAVGAAPGASILAQEADDAVEEVPEEAAPMPPPGPAVELRLGERFSTGEWDLEAQSVFTAPAPGLEEKTEVRIAVAVRNNFETPLRFSDTSFVADPAYPGLVLVDGAGVEHPLSAVDLPAHAIGQSDLRNIQNGMTARWTVGFTVPSDAAGGLKLVARSRAGNDLASWNLDEALPTGPWDPPAAAQPLSFGDTVDWNGDGLDVTPVDYGTLVCGDPETQFVTQIVALRFRVGNRSFASDAFWPTSGYPDSAAVARWPDGAAAAEVFETYSGAPLPLDDLFADRAIVPASVEPDYERVLLFGVPRDSRVGSVTDAPEGVLLNLGDGTSRWLAVSGPPTVPIEPTFCDPGFLGFPQGVAFGPSTPFEVATVPLALEVAADQDREAEALIGRALIGVSAYFLENGTYNTMTSEALEATGVNVDFTNDIELLVPGVVAWDVLEREVVVVLTESRSGQFFCAANQAFGDTVFAFGEEALATASVCVATFEQPEAAAAVEDLGDGGDGTGT